MYRENYRRKIIVIIVAVISFIAIVSLIYIYARQTNQYDTWLRVSNLSDYTNKTEENKSSIDYMEYDLHKTVSMNSDDEVNTDSVSDFIVRNGSFQEAKDESGIYTVEFIADSESLKQSYAIFYQWIDSTDPKVTNELSDQMQHWRTAVSCLPTNKLIYGSFDCTDMQSNLSNTTGPTITISNWGIKDSIGNQLSGQVEFYEQYFIEYQILGEYLSRNNIDRLSVSASIVGQPKREVVKGNYMKFDVQVEEETYAVSIDYNNDRLVKIVSNKSGKSIQRDSSSSSA